MVAIPGAHKDTTIAFRPSAWAKAVIEQKAGLSGMYKKDFITRCCLYSNIVVVGRKENIQRIRGKLSGVKRRLSVTRGNNCGYRGWCSIPV